jgi:anti-sigma regulatory factor (Ser/Thr protein kinase)
VSSATLPQRVRSAGLTLPHEVAAVGAARRALDGYLQDHAIDPDSRDDAQLVLTELISNAIRHAPPRASGDLDVAWGLDRRHIYLEVTDGKGSTEPQQVPTTHPESIGGRGLAIVTVLTSTWGVRLDDTGRTVYAVLPR